MILNRGNQYEYQKITLPILPSVPCLTTTDEQKYLYWLAKDVYQDKGAFVEVGTWFGCSAGYIAAGLRDAQKNNPLFCFDRFSLSSSERARVREQGFNFEHMANDSDTSTFVQKHLKAIYKNCSLKKVLIEEMSWSQGPIEIMHLDAPKRAMDIQHVLKVFRPYFIPQQTIIVIQDFCVPRAYALPLIFGVLKSSFELVHIPSSTSTMATFVYRKPFSQNDIIDLQSLPMAQSWRMVQDFLPSFSSEQQRLLMVGFAFYCYDRGQKEMAQEIINSL